MIIVMRVSTIVDFHVVLEEDGAYPMIFGRPWLIKSHALEEKSQYVTITFTTTYNYLVFATKFLLSTTIVTSC